MRSSNAITAGAQVRNLPPPPAQSKISTGICFLDHMIDQLTSHAQLGVTLRCGVRGLAPSCVKDGHPHQRSNSKSFLAAAAGRAIDVAKGAPQESFLARAAQ